MQRVSQEVSTVFDENTFSRKRGKSGKDAIVDAIAKLFKHHVNSGSNIVNADGAITNCVFSAPQVLKEKRAELLVPVTVSDITARCVSYFEALYADKPPSCYSVSIYRDLEKARSAPRELYLLSQRIIAGTVVPAPLKAFELKA